MNIKNVDYVLTASSIFGSLEAYWKKQIDSARISRQAVIPLDVRESASGTPIQARIYRQQWIADCECNGATYVDPSDPRFFCFSCGNRANDGHPRPVIFPDNRQEIEQAILERPVDDLAGITDTERVNAARPMIAMETGGALWREWRPGETLEDLVKQHADPLRKWHKTIKAGK